MCLTAIFGACTILCLHDSATEACFLDGKVYVLGGMHLDWKVVTTGMRPCTASAYFGRLLGARRCRNSCYGRIWFCLKLLRVSARGLGVARHIKQILVQRRLRSWKPLVLIARPTDNQHIDKILRRPCLIQAASFCYELILEPIACAQCRTIGAGDGATKPWATVCHACTSLVCSKQRSTFLTDKMSGRKVPDSGVDFCYVTVYEAHQLMKNDKALCIHGSMHVTDSFVS